MNKKTIKVKKSESIIDAQVELTSNGSKCLKIILSDGKTYSSSSSNFFDALAILRQEAHKDGIEILCKGAQLNVFPSGMCRSMGGGVAAYELNMGKQARRDDLVNIFDYSDKDITADVEHQKAYFSKWLSSLGD